MGFTTATALATSAPDPGVFRSGRQFAAYLGLVPRQTSSGGKERLGHISKRGNGALRRLLVVAPPQSFAGPAPMRPGPAPGSGLSCKRKTARRTTVAVANSEPGSATGSSAPRTARIAWALLARGDSYRAA